MGLAGRAPGRGRAVPIGRGHGVRDLPEKVGTILATLDSAFNLNLLLLVPVLVVLVGSVMKLPTVPVMLVSCATAMFNAVVFQGVSFSNSVAVSVNSFKVDMVGKSGFQRNYVQLFREDRVPPC